jgi:cytochrome c biogenesis protein CcmG/thiol:disulfide interchange protein DsbE
LASRLNTASTPSSASLESNAPSPWLPRLFTLGLVLGILALLTLFVWGLGRRAATNVGVVQTALREAPSFQLDLFDGTSTSLESFKGTPVLVNFWASWCIPCEDEAPALESAAQRYKGKVQFIGVDVQDAEPEARQFLRRYGVTYANGPDRTGSVSIDYGMAGVPETYFISPDGHIRRKWAGPLTSAQLYQFLTEISTP